MRVVDQREVQRWPGRGYPTSKMVVRLLGEAGLLSFLKPLRVLDLTFGQGIWWMGLPQARIAAFDIRRLDWKRRPNCFFQQPAQSWWSRKEDIEDCLGGPPDLVAVDPPWQVCARGREVGGRYYYRASNAIGTPESMLVAAARAAAYYESPLLIHYKDRWVAKGFTVAVEVWWKPFLPNVDKYKNWWAVLKRARETP